MLTPEFHRACGEAIAYLSRGAPLRQVLEMIVLAAEESTGAACSVFAKPQGLRVSSAGLGGGGDGGSGEPRNARSFERPDEPFAVVWREPILGSGDTELGLFCLFKWSGSAFDEGDLTLAEVCRHLAGMAIERRCREQALRERERQLATLVAGLPGMAYQARCEPGWTLQFVSSGCEALTGYGAVELIGDGRVSYADLIHPRDRDRVRVVVEDAVARREPFEVEYRIYRKDGQERVVWEKGGEVEPAGFVAGFVMDVTDRVMMDARAHQAQKLQALGTLAAGVAHNFNNLLMGIRGCISVARTRLPQGSPADPFLEEAYGAMDRGVSLTRQLLIYSGRTPADHRPIDINDVVRRSAWMLRRVVGERASLVTDLISSGGGIAGDPAQLEQVLVKLVENAHQATEGNGTITVRTRNVDRNGRSHVALEVADDGYGADSVAEHRMYEALFPAARPGLGVGVGLSSVYRIALEHGGHIEVDSAPGRGTTVCVLIPRASGGSAVTPD